MTTAWSKNGIRGWIQTFRDGEVRVSFAVWIRDVDASGYFDDLDAAYEEGERVLSACLPEIEESPLAGRLVEVQQQAAGEDDFIAVRKWASGGQILTAGVIQQDTDLPVMVVIALQEPGPAST
ncbi:hypothetical protein I3F58_06370 [Streptomyces sp. MUM 203J]|uniref:hypothetical protein n=1 Tax=Streptomyces sp. MUM 203J TaxID=2791990 RepID=UPI001F048252|nr:hypothetical protein [Streptomyces sp. MUM 203J]MCH0539185.1 hypothetical protein [Streptomyces sp. MUM 203J]